MKIVLSRKGFDSTKRYGAKPSPIFNGTRLLSLPIPEDKKKTICYSDVQDPSAQFQNLGVVGDQLTNGKIKGNCFAHLDPDLRANSLDVRLPGWQPIFGQVDQSQTHLSNQGVGNGDLFLFYGLYRDVRIRGTNIEYVPGKPRKHVIWGWMFIGDVQRVNSESCDPKWARYHPHFSNKRSANNTVYIAAKEAFGIRPGAGVFEEYQDELCLTDMKQEKVLPSLWRLPTWCKPQDDRYPLTYHQKMNRWKVSDDCVLLQTKSPGQEFVLNTEFYPKAEKWAESLIRRNAKHQIIGATPKPA